MRAYLSTSNLVKASVLGFFMAMLSVPRMMHGGVWLTLYIPMAWVCMTLVSGAATAWGDKAGMCGLFPDGRRTLTGLAVVALVVAVVLPIQYFWTDPIVRAAIAETGNARLMHMRFPATVAGCLALVLWSASFETMFFQAATMSFVARLTGRQWAALAFAVAFRTAVGAHQVREAGITDAVPLMIGLSFINSVLLGVAFARGGLPVVSALSAGLTAHLFLGRG